MVSLYKIAGRRAWQASWFDHAGVRRTRSTKTTDKRTAERIAQKYEAESALRKGGVVDATQDRYIVANRRPIGEHIADYLSHCAHVGLAEKSIADKKARLSELVEAMAASRLSDLTSDAAERALAAVRAGGAATRTTNRRREILIAFASWC